jgi:purine-binding chemotaxis protein CheW
MDRYQVLPFWLAGQHFAIALEHTVRVLPALLSTPLPGAPATVRGLVNVRGRILPVVDLGQRFGWPSSELSLWQPFIWLKSSRRELLVPVERVEAVRSCAVEDFAPAPDPRVPSELLEGVVRTSDGMLLVQDVEQVLSDAEERCLAAALERQGGAADER